MKKKVEYTQAVAVDSFFKYLLLMKRAFNPGKGLLSGVGGTVEEGEKPEECMRREWMEETGLSLEDAKVIHLVSIENDRCINHIFGIVLPDINIYYSRPIGEGLIRWHHIVGCNLLDLKNEAVAWDGMIPYCFNLLKKEYFSAEVR